MQRSYPLAPGGSSSHRLGSSQRSSCPRTHADGPTTKSGTSLAWRYRSWALVKRIARRSFRFNSHRTPLCRVVRDHAILHPATRFGSSSIRWPCNPGGPVSLALPLSPARMTACLSANGNRLVEHHLNIQILTYGSMPVAEATGFNTTCSHRTVLAGKQHITPTTVPVPTRY